MRKLPCIASLALLLSFNVFAGATPEETQLENAILLSSVKLLECNFSGLTRVTIVGNQMLKLMEAVENQDPLARVAELTSVLDETNRFKKEICGLLAKWHNLQTKEAYKGHLDKAIAAAEKLKVRGLADKQKAGDDGEKLASAEKLIVKAERKLRIAAIEQEYLLDHNSFYYHLIPLTTDGCGIVRNYAPLREKLGLD